MSFNVSSGASATPSTLGEDTTQTGPSPSIKLVDNTAAEEDFLILLDGGIVNLRDDAQADGTLLALDLPNNRVGIGTAAPSVTLDVRGAAIFNEAGADADFRVEGDTDANLLFVDASTDRVGIGTATPATLLDVNGAVNVTGALTSPGAGANSFKAGTASVASGTGDVAIGNNSSATGTTTPAVAIGDGAEAEAIGAVAIGRNAGDAGIGSHAVAIGNGADATGLGNVAISLDATATGNSSVAIGQSAKADATSSTSIGANSDANGINSSAFGVGSQATANQSTALGDAAVASAVDAVAVGQSADATVASTVAIGADAQAVNEDTIVLGTASASTAVNQFVAGSLNTAMLNVYFDEGVVSASPGGFTLHASGGSGTDIAGGNITFAPGQGTGTGAGGELVFQTATAGSTSSTPNALATRLQIDDVSGNAAFTSASNSASDIFGLTVTSNNAGSGVPGGIDMSSFSVDEPLLGTVADAITSAGTVSHQIAIDIGGTVFYLVAHTHGS